MIYVDERLKTIANMIDITDGGCNNAVVADIGSDHAYLPVWLYANKKIKKAYAADISVNSVEKIKRNIARYNISPDIIVPVLSDGLSAFESNIYNAAEITHIIIAGMGGNNIAGIIGNSDIAKQKVLILQPNTKAEFLRKFLYNNSFDITDENIAVDNGRLYLSIRAEYNASTAINSVGNKDIDLLDIIIGRRLREKNPKPSGYKAYLLKQLRRLRNILNDLDAKDGSERDNVTTDYGVYGDIENLILRIEKEYNNIQ